MTGIHDPLLTIRLFAISLEPCGKHRSCAWRDPLLLLYTSTVNTWYKEREFDVQGTYWTIDPGSKISHALGIYSSIISKVLGA